MTGRAKAIKHRIASNIKRENMSYRNKVYDKTKKDKRSKTRSKKKNNDI